MKQHNEHKPRLLAWLLCLVMLLGMLPGNAAAAEKTEEVILKADDWEVAFQYNDNISDEDKTDENTLKSYVSLSSNDDGITMSINTSDNVVSKGGYYLYYNPGIKNAKNIKVTYTYGGNIYWASLFGFDESWSYIGANDGAFSFDNATTMNRIGFNVSNSSSAINGTLTVTKVEVTTVEEPSETEYTISTTNAFMGDSTTANGPEVFTPKSAKIESKEQTFQLSLKEWTGNDGSYFAPDSVTAAKEDGTDVSNAVKLKLDKATGKVTLDTTGVAYNIILSARYIWTAGSTAPSDKNTITTIQPTFNGEAVEWFEPFDPTSASVEGKEQTFRLKVDVWKNDTGAAQPDSVAAKRKDTGADVSTVLKLTLDKKTGVVTLDTSGVDYDIILSANYVWVMPGGDQPGPTDPATGPDWTFDSNTQGWRVESSWGVNNGAATAWENGRLGVTSNWSDGNSQVTLSWEPSAPVSVAGKNYLLMDAYFDASKLTDGALSIEPFAGKGEENLLQTVEPVSHWNGTETVTEITGLQGAALSASGAESSGGLSKQTLYFCFDAESSSIPKFSLRINGTAANAYNGTLYLDNIRFGTAPGYIATTCSLNWKPEVFTPGGFIPILEREQTFRAKITESGFELDKITISAEHGTAPKITDEMSSSGLVTINTKGLSGKVVLNANYVWPPEFNFGGSSEPGYTPALSGSTASGGSGNSAPASGPSAEITTSVRSGGAYAEVSAADITKLITQAEKAKEPVKELTIAPKVSQNSPLRSSELTIQAAELASLGEKTEANLRVGSHIADVTFANRTLTQMAEKEQPVTVSTERIGNTVKVTVSSGDTPLSQIPGGVKVDLHASCGFYTVAYLVPDPNHPENRQQIPLSMASQDGKTMQILLPGSGAVVLADKRVDFYDMPADLQGIGPVYFAASHGIFNGGTDGNFRPNNSMTRAMMMQILYNFEGRPEGRTAQFTDTKSTDWYAAAAGWAVDKGIVNGYADGSFVPNSIITRQQAVCFLYRWAGSPKVDTAYLEEFSDAADVGGFARSAMAWAAKNGIFGGGTALLPTESVSRYQAAQMMTNLVAHEMADPWTGKEW